MPSHLIRETANLGMLYAPAESAILVISFAHMDFDINGGRFWGQDAVRKAGFAGIGLICRANSWFPEKDIAELSGYINEISKNYQNTVLYGFSMGGYAAIKHSRILNAQVSIALSPQFSINPADVYGHDRRLMKFFDPMLNDNMAIRGEDMGGRIYMFHDPYLAADQWNCEQIVNRDGIGADIRTVLVPRIGHETIDIFAGTELLANLVRYSIEDDMDALRRLTSLSRRRAERRVFNLLMALRQKAPERAETLFAKYGDRLSQHWHQLWAAPFPTS